MEYILIIIAATIATILAVRVWYYNNVVEEININNIKIKPEFKQPNKSKLMHRRKYFLETGNFYNKIILDKQNQLLDGYTSYLIAQELGIEIVTIIRDTL